MSIKLDVVCIVRIGQTNVVWGYVQTIFLGDMASDTGVLAFRQTQRTLFLGCMKCPASHTDVPTLSVRPLSTFRLGDMECRGDACFSH